MMALASLVQTLPGPLRFFQFSVTNKPQLIRFQVQLGIVGGKLYAAKHKNFVIIAYL